MKVIKRNGKLELFDPIKIRTAVEQANAEMPDKDKITASSITWIVKSVIDEIGDVKKIHVEEIQDLVENHLIRLNKANLAKHYIKYRYRQGLVRDKYSELMSAVENKLKANNIQNQNANMDEASFSGRIGEASNLLNKQYALDYIISENTKRNHLENRIYIHDLDHYAVGDHNCLSLPIDKLLEEGFNTRQTDVRPAGSVNTAMQLVAVCMQLQSLNQFGGVSVTHLDHTMVPYVQKSFSKHFKDGLEFIRPKIWKWFKDTKTYEPPKELSLDDPTICKQRFRFVYNYALKLTKREIYQSVEGLYHNLNTLQSRSGGQLPFSSINYGTCIKEEGRLVTEALIKCSITGLGKLRKTSIFPCGIFQCMKGVNLEKDDPNYDLFKLALKSTAQRLYPNYCNCDWSGNAGYDKNDPKTYFSTMGCRTANGWDINGFGQLKDGRGNICPTTIILPTLAMEAKEKFQEFKKENPNNRKIKLEDIFLHILGEACDQAKDSLIERFDYICSQKPESARFMYENGLMAGYVPEEGIQSALKHGTLALGMLGLAETLQILINCNHTTNKGMELAKRICALMNNKCAQYKEEYKLNFGLYYTPAENLCHTALNKFRDRYGIIEKVSDKEYFTNSIHIPVWEDIDPFTKIDLESQLTGYSSAGCITYVELPSTAQHNLEALEKLVKYALDKDIPYFAINLPNDSCQECGYTGEINDKCPMCGCTTIKRLRRVTGYLTGDFESAFNKGKIAETKDRVKHVR